MTFTKMTELQGRDRFLQPGARWHTGGDGHSLMNPVTRSWLLDRGSLTRRLKRLSGNQFQVIALRNEAGPLLPEECKLLGLQAGASGWVREVYLAGLGRPWVFARSIISCLEREPGTSPLFGLGEIPLGTVLFGDAPYERSEIEVYRSQENGQAGQQDAEPLWARRSLFSRGRNRVLVQEVFLPQLWDELSKTALVK